MGVEDGALCDSFALDCFRMRLVRGGIWPSALDDWRYPAHGSVRLQPDGWSSLTAIVLFYSALFVVEMYLMLHFIRKGPSSLGTGKYHFEQIPAATGAQS